MTRNYSEKVINKVLDLVSGSQNMELLQARATAPPRHHATAPPRHQMQHTMQAHPAGAPCRQACRLACKPSV